MTSVSGFQRVVNPLLNDKVMGEGAGGSKKHAEQQAARDALSKQGL